MKFAMFVAIKTVLVVLLVSGCAGIDFPYSPESEVKRACAVYHIAELKDQRVEPAFGNAFVGGMVTRKDRARIRKECAVGVSI